MLQAMQTLQAEVLEANPELVRRGLVLYTFGNASAVSREAGLIAIKPSGVPYDKMTPAELAQFPPPGVVWVHDPRIKAAVIAAPAIGYTFDRAGLKDVRLPIQLWRDEFDHVEPSPDYVETVRDALPTPPEYHVVANADHYDFLAPCSATLTKYAPLICAERPGFDRAAFHATFDAAVVAFFEKTLAAH